MTSAKLSHPIETFLMKYIHAILWSLHSRMFYLLLQLPSALGNPAAKKCVIITCMSKKIVHPSPKYTHSTHLFETLQLYTFNTTLKLSVALGIESRFISVEI